MILKRNETEMSTLTCSIEVSQLILIFINWLIEIEYKWRCDE